MKRLLEILKIPSAIIGFITLIASVSIYGYKIVTKIDTIGVKQTEQIRNDSIFIKWIGKTELRLNEIERLNKMQDNNFVALEKSHINALKIIDRIDEVIKYYESKVELEKKRQQRQWLDGIEIKREKL